MIYTKLLTEQLALRGHQVWLVCRPNSWISQQDIPCQKILSNLGRFPNGASRRIGKFINANQIDLVHTHMTRAHTFGSMLRIHTTAPVIKTAHSRSMQLHWRFSDYVIANSEATREYHMARNRIQPNQIETIHCFVNQAAYQDIPAKQVRRIKGQLRWRDCENLLGIVGQVIPRKGHEYLIQALPRLCYELPDLRLVLVGGFNRRNGYVRKVRQFINENGLHKKTKWIGLRDNVQDFFAAMKVCVIPSLEEPLGMVAIESQLAGTPVVASQVGGLTEVVEHERTGLLVPPKDPDAIADAVLRIIRTPSLERKLINCGQRRANHRFSTERLTDQIERVYQDQVTAKRHAA